MSLETINPATGENVKTWSADSPGRQVSGALGFGRELSDFGIRELVDVETVYIG